MDKPSISVIIPTYNSGRFLAYCLESIKNQDYPKNKVEIIIADGGSSDKTIEIAKRYTKNIYKNRLKTGEAGKSVGAKKAKNEILAFIDSDNILEDGSWLQRMVEPFQDKKVVGTEPLYYSYRKQDSYINRYCALMGMNDPICFFYKNYDRYNHITKKWTGLNVKQQDKGNYILIEFDKKNIPTIGANGFLIKRKEFNQVMKGDYSFDIDIVYNLVNLKKSFFAKVKVGIIHLFCEDLGTFIRKQRRRINDYFYYQKKEMRSYSWKNNFGLFRFVISTLLIFPLLYQAFKGFLREPDSAWFFHPVACWITLFVYSTGYVKGKFNKLNIERKNWKQ